MKVSGFTFIRNGTLMGYPFIESINSLLPLVDEFVINVGDSEDNTAELVAALTDPKIRVIRSTWNEGMKSRGFVYAQQKMIAQFSCTGDWAFYLEGDEVLHPDDGDRIHSSMRRHLHNPRVEALAFRYHHFYGRPDQVLVSGALCRNEVRIIRNTIRCYAPDALFWMVMKNNRRGRYPYAAHTGAHIYHYGWARSSSRMLEKFQRIERYWGKPAPASFRYGNIDPQALQPFTGEHPPLMRRWLENEAEHSYVPNPGYQPTMREKKRRVLNRLTHHFGWDFSKSHYIPV